MDTLMSALEVLNSGGGTELTLPIFWIIALLAVVLALINVSRSMGSTKVTAFAFALLALLVTYVLELGILSTWYFWVGLNYGAQKITFSR
jgi:hypothetical protein